MSNVYTKKISLTITRKDKQLIKRAAKMSGKTMAAFIRESAEEQARWVLGEPKLKTWLENSFQLSDAEQAGSK